MHRVLPENRFQGSNSRLRCCSMLFSRVQFGKAWAGLVLVTKFVHTSSICIGRPFWFMPSCSLIILPNPNPCVVVRRIPTSYWYPRSLDSIVSFPLNSGQSFSLRHLLVLRRECELKIQITITTSYHIYLIPHSYFLWPHRCCIWHDLWNWSAK